MIMIDRSKVEMQMECSTCQWNKNCIEPPMLSKEEIEKMIREKTDVEDAEKSMFGGLMTAMMFAGKDQECRVCPVFAKKLAESPELSDRIKEIMKSL